MGEARGFDLDGETIRAWSAFTNRLADRLADLSQGETLSLGFGGTNEEGNPVNASRVDFVALPEGMLRRTRLSATDEVTGEQVTRQREADQVAAESVAQLRDDLGVVHPAFLTVTGASYPGQDGRPLGQVGATEVSQEKPAAQLTEPVDASHLLDLAFAAITHGLGREPMRDIDGDLVVESGTTRVYVRVLHQAPVIQLFSRLVHHVTHPQSADAIVAGLNNDYPFVKFLFADNAVLASVHVPAIPFVPAQLRHMLAVFSGLADELDDELARRLGGEREVERVAGPDPVEEEEPEGLPPELMTLVRLDPEGHGLDPEEAAEICGYDRALTRQLLHIAIGQEEVWQQAAKESVDDAEQEARATEEASGWAATRRSLSGALDLIDAVDD